VEGHDDALLEPAADVDTSRSRRNAGLRSARWPVAGGLGARRRAGKHSARLLQLQLHTECKLVIWTQNRQHELIANKTMLCIPRAPNEIDDARE
jgi:hypothetical protein